LECIVISKERLTTQHKVLVIDVRVERREKRISTRCDSEDQVMARGNRGLYQHKILEGGFEKLQESANDMWDKITCEIRQVAKKTIRESIGFGYIGVKNLN
jgi:hypothetical protein